MQQQQKKGPQILTPPLRSLITKNSSWKVKISYNEEYFKFKFSKTQFSLVENTLWNLEQSKKQTPPQKQ